MIPRICGYGIILLIGSTILSACSKTPDGVLSEKDMQNVMTDMQLAEIMITSNYTQYPDDAHKKALYESVFRKYKINQAIYDSSLVWYGRNIDVYMQVYDRVLADLDQKIKDFGNVQSEALNIKEDSVDIWPYPSFLTFKPRPSFNGVVFDIHPEVHYSSGSSFVLSMNVWGLRKEIPDGLELRLGVDQGDTIITVNNKITHDGTHEMILKSMPTKQVRRVFGFIRMDNADTTYYKIYADSIQMIRYKYGSLSDSHLLPVASDSMRVVKKEFVK